MKRVKMGETPFLRQEGTNVDKVNQIDKFACCTLEMKSILFLILYLFKAYKEKPFKSYFRAAYRIKLQDMRQKLVSKPVIKGTGRLSSLWVKEFKHKF